VPAELVAAAISGGRHDEVAGPNLLSPDDARLRVVGV